MPTGYTTVSAAALKDSTGTLIASATISFQPVNNHGQAISFKAGGGGQTISAPVTAVVTAGAFTIQLADTTLTTPANVGYSVTVIDNVTGKSILGPGYSDVQPSGSTWSFDTYTPNLAALVIQQVGIQGPPGAMGTPGTNGTNGTNGEITKVQMISGVQLALNSGAPKLRNLFDASAITSGQAIVAATGALSPSTNYFVSDYTYIGGLPFITNTMLAAQAAFAACYYDVNRVFVSALPTTAANVVVTPPTNAAYIRFYSAIVADGVNTAPVAAAAIMLASGTVLPGSYVGFGYYAPNQVDSKIAVVNATATATAATVAATKATASAYLPLNQNLVDLNRTTANTAIHNASTAPTVTAVTGFTLAGQIPVLGGGTVTSNKQLHANGGFGPAFQDASGNFLVPTGAFLAFITAGVGIPANTPIAVPANAAFFRPYVNVSSSGTGNLAPIDSINTWMVVQGSTFPTAFQPFIGAPIPDVTARALAQPLAGVPVGWLGDSISAGQGSTFVLSPLVAAITGHTDAFSLSWSGRQMWHALDNTGATGTAFPTSTIVQSLKMLVLWLGTNLDGSSNGNIGLATDTASVGTSNANGITFPSTDSYCSQLKGVIEQLLAWNPSLRIIKASPYQSNNQNAQTGGTGGAGHLPTPAGLALLKAVHDADVAVAGLQYGIPVLDLFSEMGLCIANNATMLVDGTHPTATTQKTRIAPYFGRRLPLYSPQ